MLDTYLPEVGRCLLSLRRPIRQALVFALDQGSDRACHLRHLTARYLRPQQKHLDPSRGIDVGVRCSGPLLMRVSVYHPDMLVADPPEERRGMACRRSTARSFRNLTSPRLEMTYRSTSG